MVRDDMEQGSKAIMQTSIRTLPADEWRRAPYLSGTSDSFWRKAEAFVPETEIPEEPLSLVSEVSAHLSDWVESILSNLDSVYTLMASRALKPIRLSTELSIRKNNANIDLMVSRWSTDTHTFVFAWGDGGPMFQDTAILMRLSMRGSVAFDPSNLSPTDARLVDQLRRAYTAAGKCGSCFDKEGRVRTPPKSGKTSWGYWLRYFFMDLPPPGTVPPVGQATEFYGKMYDSDLHLTGFLVYRLSFFVIPDFPYEGPNHTVFPLAVSLARWDFVPLGPLFLGSLFHRLDQVYIDAERSMGRYNMVSVVHTQFLMAFCLEHFPSLAPSPTDISGGDEPRPRIMRWSGVSSTKSWGNQIDDVGAFFPRPYAEPIEGALPTSFFSENDRIVDFQTEGVVVSTSALAAFAAACPCSLPALCAEGRAPCCIVPTGAHVEELAEGYNVVAPSSTTPAASHGITIAEPISTVIPPRMTRAKANEQSSLQQQGPQFKRLRKQGLLALKRLPRVSYEGGEHTPLSKLKRKREGKEAREEGSDSSIDDTIPISQSFKLPRVAQPIPSGTSVAAVETALDLFDRHVNVPPTSDLATHFQAHDVAVALTNLTSAEVFADLQDDSFIFLGIPQAGYTVGNVGEGKFFTGRGVRDLYSQTMGQLQLECLYTFLQSLKDIRVCDLGLNRIQEIGLTVQNFDKLGFDIWWVYKELDAAKIMRENDLRWRLCEGAKAALEEAHVALARA
ncbi:hypothetical protein C3L33_20418, partial [Rhododendron williamsianum]